MRKFVKIRKLKIIEQILIVLLFAVVIPLAISGFIINNINQQSMRSQLRDSAILISRMVSEEADVFLSSAESQLNQIAIAMNTMPSNSSKNFYLKTILNNSPECEDILILRSLKDVELLKNESHK